jgi:hypothetical protein
MTARPVRELCRGVRSGTVSYRALPPSKPDLGFGEPAVAVIAARTMGGLDFAAGWVTRPGRSRWRLTVWVQASSAAGPQRVPGTRWGIRRALDTAAVSHQQAMAGLYAGYARKDRP